MVDNTQARAVANEVARVSYGKLLAMLAARTRNISGAEDALADAFAAALENWPHKGVPESPEAWLLTAARRKMIDASRRDATRDRAVPEIERAMDEIQDKMSDNANDQTFPDERLKLLFICAHPAIDKTIRTPLMLQTVLNLDARRIARAFLVAPATMGQRLVRAKRKIAEAGISFDTPGPSLIEDRLDAVLNAVYAAFNAGYDDSTNDEAGFAEEAIYLASLITGLAPDFAEGHGALALMLYAHARREARQPSGVYVPFTEQNTELWDHHLIDTAERALFRASRLNAPGRYQIEAAIQSAHVASRLRGQDTRDDIVKLYDRLIIITPTTGAKVGKAASLIQLDRTGEAIAILDDISEAHAKLYQPYWAARAHALQILGNNTAADRAYDLAITLSNDPAARRYLIEKRAQLDL